MFSILHLFIWLSINLYGFVKVGKNATTNYIKFWQLPQKPLSSFIVLLNKNKILSKKERIVTNILSNNHD